MKIKENLTNILLGVTLVSVLIVMGILLVPSEQVEPEFNFGGTPRRPTEFKTNLAQQFTEGHSGTTLKVTTVTTKDGNTLDGDVLGDTIVLSINSGASNSETVLCTTLTTSTNIGLMTQLRLLRLISRLTPQVNQLLFPILILI